MSGIDFEEAKKLFSELCHHLEYINNSLQEIKTIMGGNNFDPDIYESMADSLNRIANKQDS